MEISNIKTASGKIYTLNVFRSGEYQYKDRYYQFDYIPDELRGYIHIKTHGDDKLISEDKVCFCFDCDKEAEVYVIYPDKQPVLPHWLEGYERVRMNVTRMDTMASTLKGYFSVYKKAFAKGTVTLYGCSPNRMLGEEWYVESMGGGYCMYSLCVKPVHSM